MKTIIISVVVVLVIAGAGAFTWWRIGTYPVLETVGTLIIHEPSVTIARLGRTLSGEAGMPLGVGDGIETDTNGNAGVMFTTGSLLRIATSTELHITNHNRFSMRKGEVWSSVQPLATGDLFDIETPVVTASVRGTEFTVTYTGIESRIMLISGGPLIVFLNNAPDQTKTMEAGEIFIIRDTFAAEDFVKGSVSISTKPAVTPRPAVTPKTIITPATTISNVPTNSITKLTLQSREGVTASVGKPLSLQVIATHQDGTTADVTASVSWQQFPGLGLIDNFGNFRATADGKTVITAMLQHITSNELTLEIKTQSTEKSYRAQ